MLSDAAFALRQLRKFPGFTLLALATLAVGIGLNTAIFSLVHDLFLRGLPFEQPERLLHLYSGSKDGRFNDFPLSIPRYLHYREGQTAFTGLAAETRVATTLTGLGDPQQMLAVKVTANYFDVLDVKPLRGRNFTSLEEEGADVVLISDAFWRGQLASDPNVLGRSLVLDGVPHTVVGVMPKLPMSWTIRNNDLWTTKPFSLPAYTTERLMRGVVFLRVVGRIRPDLSLDQAQSALAGLAQSYAEKSPDKTDAGMIMRAVPLPLENNERLRPAFGTLFAAVGLVLLIACSNVANLLLVRFSGRRREIAVRLALGAPRARVLRLFVLESVLLGLLAAAIGALLAWQLVPLVPRLAANFLPLDPGGAPGLSAPVLGFTIGLALLTSLALGLYPAWQGSRVDLVSGLTEGGRGASGSVRPERFRQLLVGAQVALSVTLLAGAALLIASFVRLSRQPLGFRPENLWLGFVNLPLAHYPDPPARVRFVDQALAALRAVPGFESVSVGDAPLVSGGALTAYARPDGIVPPPDDRPRAPSPNASPDFFRTLGIPLLAGRVFNEFDVADHPDVLVISQSGARKLFGDENPLGRTLLLSGSPGPVEIIGIVGDVRSARVAAVPEAEFYRPWAQASYSSATFIVHSPLRTDAVTKLAQAALATIDPTVAISQPNSMDHFVAQSLGEARLLMLLLGLFAGVALALATVGIYGAVAYTVGQRTGEIGVRMALGAQSRDVLRLVIAQGMRPVLAGLAVGLAASLALGRLIAAQLFETSAHSPLLLLATLATLGIAALLACLVPALRASLINPIEALRAG